jgi:hypothetical protein
MNDMQYQVRPNHCDCHPETCGCNPWAVYDGDKKIISFYHQSDAQEYALTYEIKRNQELTQELLSKLSNK